MAIETLSEAVSYLKNELVNEIDNHTQFKHEETRELADIIIKVFASLEEELNR